MRDDHETRQAVVIDANKLEADLLATELPSGFFTIEPHESWLMNDAILAPGNGGDFAHPMYAFYATQGGMGVSLDEVFHLAQASAEDGPMLGGIEFDLWRPLRVGEDFRVDARFGGLRRKHGASGVFDLVELQLTLVDSGGCAAAETSITYLFPRREAL